MDPRSGIQRRYFPPPLLNIANLKSNAARKLELAHPEYFKMRVVPLLPGIGPIISYVSGKKASINCEDFYTKMKTILKSPPAANYQIQYKKPVSASDAGSSLNRTPEESESGEPVSTG